MRYSRWETGTEENKVQIQLNRNILLGTTGVFCLAAVFYMVFLFLRKGIDPSSMIIVVILLVAAMAGTLNTIKKMTRNTGRRLAVTRRQIDDMRQDLGLISIMANPVESPDLDDFMDPINHDVREPVITAISFDPKSNHSYKTYGRLLNDAGKNGLIEVGIQVDGDKLRLFYEEPFKTVSNRIDKRDHDAYRSPDVDLVDGELILK